MGDSNPYRVPTYLVPGVGQRFGQEGEGQQPVVLFDPVGDPAGEATGHLELGAAGIDGAVGLDAGYPRPVVLPDRKLLAARVGGAARPRGSPPMPTLE